MHKQLQVLSLNQQIVMKQNCQMLIPTRNQTLQNETNPRDFGYFIISRLIPEKFSRYYVA
ncbi:hypothetical protein NM04_17440 [Massilia aurea]|uniref:Uncharacterized protein n=1 Tax=Massilia aurea TaxID=373040 RepID=A0A422QHW3_9BURK|nr:hypothetical protein NM04_17440 [Massilia aurea]